MQKILLNLIDIKKTVVITLHLFKTFYATRIRMEKKCLCGEPLFTMEMKEVACTGIPQGYTLCINCSVWYKQIPPPPGYAPEWRINKYSAK